MHSAPAPDPRHLGKHWPDPGGPFPSISSAALEGRTPPAMLENEEGPAQSQAGVA